MDAEQTAHNRRVMDALTRIETAQTTGFARTETTLQAIVQNPGRARRPTRSAHTTRKARPPPHSGRPLNFR